MCVCVVCVHNNRDNRFFGFGFFFFFFFFFFFCFVYRNFDTLSLSILSIHLSRYSLLSLNSRIHFRVLRVCVAERKPFASLEKINSLAGSVDQDFDSAIIVRVVAVSALLSRLTCSPYRNVVAAAAIAAAAAASHHQPVVAGSLS